MFSNLQLLFWLIWCNGMSNGNSALFLFVCLSFSSVCASCSRPYQCCCLGLSPLVALLFYSDSLFSLDFLFD